MSRQEDTAPHRPQRSPTGRAIVIGIWVALVGWITVATLVSILYDLYGNPPPQADATFSAEEQEWCVRRLTGLKAEIQSHVTNELQRPPPPSEPLSRWHPWFEAWSDAASIAANRCRSGGEAISESFERLHALATTYDEGVDRILRARTTLGQEIDADARSLTGR